MKSILRLVLVFSVPLLFFCVIRQSGKHRELRTEVSRLQKAQQERVELNRRLLAAVSVLSGRERVGSVARDDLGLTRAAPENFIRVELRAETGKLDG